MVCEEKKNNCHCHTIKILDHECICCGEKIKQGKVILFDKSKVESDIILSNDVKTQIKKFENILLSTNNLTDITQSFNNNKYENIVEDNDTNKTYNENQNNITTKIDKNENCFLEKNFHADEIHKSNEKINDNDMIFEKKYSFSFNESYNSKHSITSKPDNDNKIILQNNSIDDKTYAENSIKCLSSNEEKIENKTINHNLLSNHKTEGYQTTTDKIVNNEIYGSKNSLASSNVSNLTFKSNKSFHAPIPPTRLIKNAEIITKNMNENSEVNYSKITEQNNNIETFEKKYFSHNQQFIENSFQNESDNISLKSSEICINKKNFSNNTINQNDSSENGFINKNILKNNNENTTEIDNLARELHNDALLLSKKTEHLANLSKNINNNDVDLSENNSINLNLLKSNGNFSEEILNEKHIKTINHKTQSTTYYEIENDISTPIDKNICNDRKLSISSSSNFTSSLKAEVVNKDDLSSHLIELTNKKNNLISETNSETKQFCEQKNHYQKSDERLSSHFESSIVGEPINNNNLQKLNSQNFYHSTRTSLFEPSIYNENIEEKYIIEKKSESRQSNDKSSKLDGIYYRNATNSNVYSSECEKNNDKLRYWKDKLVQESVIDETYEDLTLYKPKMTESICPITNNKNVTIGGESLLDKCKTILLFGLPNSGKTSIVNRICNYLYGTDRSTLLRLVVKFPSELHYKQHEIITYQFNNSLLPYNLKIIDTPGVYKDDDINQFTYKKLYHNYLKPIVNSQYSFTIDAIFICHRFNSDSFNTFFNHQINGLKRIINGHIDSNNILSIFTDSDINYKIEAMKDFHIRQISKHNGLFLIHSKSYLNAKHGFSHLDYIRIYEQSESELFKLFTFLEFKVIPTKLIKKERMEILV